MSLLHVLMAGAKVGLGDLVRAAYPQFPHLHAEIEQCSFCQENQESLQNGTCVLPPAGDLTHMLPRFWDEGKPSQAALDQADKDLAAAQRRRDALASKK